MRGADLEGDDELAHLLAAQYGAEPLDAFVSRVSPRLPPPPHLAPLRRLIERTRHEEVRALVSMPPRHGKSISLLHGLAWRTEVDPGCLNAYASYGDDLSRAQSRIARRLAIEAGVRLSESSAATEWITAHGGGLVATGVGGPLTGKGITGILVCDDLIKNRVDAESPTIRARVIDWLGDVAFTRLQPGASMIVCATRWHEEDPIGHLAELGGWEVIELPAVHDGAGRAVDERVEDGAVALWPEMYPLETLATIRRTIGEHGWWSLYQQQPRVRGKRLFGEPSRFDLEAFRWEGCRGVIAVDPAASAKTHADYSAIVVAAMQGHGTASSLFVVDVNRSQVEIPQLVRALRDKQGRYRLMVAVEAVGGFKAVPQMLRDTDPRLRIVEIMPAGDKFTRAQPLAAAWGDGRVHVPLAAPWVDDYLAEMRAFTGTGDKHDDQVDATAHAWNTLYRETPSRASIGARPADHLPFR